MGSNCGGYARICNPTLGGRRVQRETFTRRILMGTAAETLKPQGQETHFAAKGTRRGAAIGLLQKLGPGLITGASDDDPSGIATYSQVGARFGYGLLWTMVLTYPLMAAIQEVSARIGRVTGVGIAANLRKNYPKALLYCVLFVVAVANIFNLGADIGAMGAAMQLVLPKTAGVFTVVFGVGSLAGVMLVPYSSYAKYLKWLTLSLFAYVGVVFFAHVSWLAVLHATVLPHLELTKEYLTALIAVLGTTISPYLFFWQASQEVEEVRNNHDEKALKRAPSQAEEQLGRIHVDTYLGMAFSNVVAFFIILTTAATLHAHGITQITTSAQAAQALEPLAGRFAFVLFVCGIVGTGLLAMPVLAASVCYGVGEACRWKTSLERKPAEAIRFYAAITVATLIGLLLNFIHIDPVKALFWAAILNGIVAAPLMAVIMTMASNRKVMGKLAIPSYLKATGWAATAVMFCACIGVIWTWK
ncbi:MAG TPA: divalent metal cation transporter [Candidatus Sulfotelmatobacter sp.]|nr:divalent metal cation transporter [Candidatus Sulfotelmatobacter sp.]